jgi:predicted dinucleotide-binding enzyme
MQTLISGGGSIGSALTDRLLETPAANGHVVNVGSKERVSTREPAERVKTAVASESGTSGFQSKLLSPTRGSMSPYPSLIK